MLPAYIFRAKCVAECIEFMLFMYITYSLLQYKSLNKHKYSSLYYVSVYSALDVMGRYIWQ